MTSADVVPLEQFLTYPSVQGVSFRRALAYGTAVVPQLQTVLNDPSRREQWPVAVTMLAMLATPEAVVTVQKFIARRGLVEAPRASERGLANAVLSLGYAANTDRSAQAHDFLLSAVSSVLDSDKQPPSSCFDTVAFSLEECDALSEQAIYALALAATAQSGKLLARVAQDPLAAKRFQSAARQALLEHKKIVALGLLAYDDARWE